MLATGRFSWVGNQILNDICLSLESTQHLITVFAFAILNNPSCSKVSVSLQYLIILLPPVHYLHWISSVSRPLILKKIQVSYNRVGYVYQGSVAAGSNDGSS